MHEEVSRVVEARIRDCAVSEAPFPHLHMTDFFPADYYDQILEQWPAHPEFVDMGGNCVLGIYFRAYTKNQAAQLEAGGHGIATPALMKTYAFWSGFRAIMQRTVIPEVAKKFAPHIRAMMRSRFPRPRPTIGGSDLEIQMDYLAFRRNDAVLPAHIDDLRSLIQIIGYLPPDNDHAHLGTQLYEQVSAGSAKTPGEMENARLAQYAHYLGIEVKPAKLIPFVRNTVVANLNHPRSWHGQAVTEAYERRTYQAFVGVRENLLPWFFDRASAKAVAPEPNF